MPDSGEKKKSLLTQQIRLCVYANLPILQYFLILSYFQAGDLPGQLNFYISILQASGDAAFFITSGTLQEHSTFASFEKRHTLILSSL